jgi:hypothetical protein
VILSDASLALLAALDNGTLKSEPSAYTAWAAKGIRDTALVDQYDSALGWRLEEEAPAVVTPDMLPGAAVIGWKPYAADADLAPRWAQIAARVQEADAYLDVEEIVGDWLEAGKDPAALDALVTLLLEHGKVDALKDYAPDTVLADARVVLEADLPLHLLAAFERIGLDQAAAIEAHSKGYSPAHVEAARRSDVPVERVAALPVGESWLKAVALDTIERLERLAVLWPHVDTPAPKGGNDRKHEGTIYSTRGHFTSVTWDLNTALALAEAGMLPADVAGFVEALSSHGRGGSRITVNVQVLADLIGAWTHGVRPSHVSDYRMCGVYKPEEIAALAREGIDGRMVKHLRATYGTVRGQYGHSARPTMQDAAALRRAFAKHLATEAAAVPETVDA